MVEYDDYGVLDSEEKEPIKGANEGGTDLFKSKLVKAFDFRDAKVSEELLAIELDVKDILKQLSNIAKKNAATIEPDDCVKPEDMILLEMESTLEKYNKKNVPISVGMGLFNKKFEEQLVGAKKGEVITINVDEHAVKAKVLSIKRRIIPPLTDELIVKENMEGINSVAELKDYLYNEKVSQLINERSYSLNYEVLQQVAAQSEYQVAEEDVKLLCGEELNRCRAISRTVDNMVFDEMTADEFVARVACNSLEQFKKKIKKGYEAELKMALVGMSMAKEEEVVFDALSYEEVIKEDIKAEPMDIETAKLFRPFLRYVAFSYTGFLRSKISEYYRNKFQINPNGAI